MTTFGGNDPPYHCCAVCIVWCADIHVQSFTSKSGIGMMVMCPSGIAEVSHFQHW